MEGMPLLCHLGGLKDANRLNNIRSFITAQEGYFVLASKMRRDEERIYVQKTIEKSFFFK